MTNFTKKHYIAISKIINKNIIFKKDSNGLTYMDSINLNLVRDLSIFFKLDNLNFNIDKFKSIALKDE